MEGDTDLDWYDMSTVVYPERRSVLRPTRDRSRLRKDRKKPKGGRTKTISGGGLDGPGNIRSTTSLVYCLD